MRYAGALRGRHRRRPEAVGERVQPRHHQVARLHHHFPLQNLRRDGIRRGRDVRSFMLHAVTTTVQTTVQSAVPMQ